MIEKSAAKKFDALKHVVENGATKDELLDCLNGAFAEQAVLSNNDSKRPFIIWNEFKQMDGTLARGLIRVADFLFKDEVVDVVATLPSSMTWVGDHIRPTDFGGAKKGLILRQPFPGSIKIGVRSYTKKTDGSLRKPEEQREPVAMYVDESFVDQKNVLVLDDVVADGLSLGDAAAALKQLGIENVWGVVGFSKNMQGGYEMLRKENSPVDVLHACIQVVSVDNGQIITKRWWENDQ